MPTAMGSAFERAGFNRAEMSLYPKAVEFIEHGGTFERWVAVYELAASKMLAAKKMRGGDHTARADHGQPWSVPTSQPSAGGKGQLRYVPNKDHCAPAAPAREPTERQRKAKAKVANVIALTVLDTLKVRDGRPIGNVRWYELERLASENSREAHLLRLILSHVQPANPDSVVRDNVSAKTLARLQQKAAERSDAAA